MYGLNFTLVSGNIGKSFLNDGEVIVSLHEENFIMFL